MASDQNTIEFLSEQIAGAGRITSRKMFGEYALYCDGKVIAFVCDDELFVKPTEAGRQYLGTAQEKPAYPGSKMYFWIDTEHWDDSEWMSELISITAAALPSSIKKK